MFVFEDFCLEKYEYSNVHVAAGFVYTIIGCACLWNTKNKMKANGLIGSMLRYC